jgi:endoplasmic reticulum lectin 1
LFPYIYVTGKSVVQYHEDKVVGQKTLINLGHFDEAKHLDWIEKNPSKRPKSKEFRKHVSHLYSDGDICDVTGKQNPIL